MNDKKEDTILVYVILVVVILALAGAGVGVFLFLRRQRETSYFPLVTGDGSLPLKGLDPAEAALILETSIDRVVGILVVGLARKRAVKVPSSGAFRLRSEPTDNLVEYEKAFLASLGSGGTVSPKSLKTLFTKWIKKLHSDLAKFDLEATREHYRNRVEQLWTQMESAENAEGINSLLAKEFEWLMLDGDLENRLEKSLDPHKIQVPSWWKRYHPVSSFAPRAGTDFWVSGEHFADSVIARVQEVAKKTIAHPEAFAADLTKRTNPEAEDEDE